MRYTDISNKPQRYYTCYTPIYVPILVRALKQMYNIGCMHVGCT